MLGRALDDSYPQVVRARVTLLAVARLAANSTYRFAPPFLATIARGTGVTLADLGLAVSVSELGGLLAPWLGRRVDGWRRRRTMSLALVAVALSAFAISASTGTVTFTIALLGIGLAKMTFDIALGGWIADHVTYERRGRVVGLTELSWAGGLLIGVPVMGLVAARTSWRGAYVIAGIAVIAVAGLLSRRLDESRRPPDPVPSAHDARSAVVPRAVRIPAVVASIGCLLGAAQCAFVTFGSWLEGSFGFTAVGLAAASFGLGLCELVASSSTIRLTDRWGKRRSVITGAALMVPTALLMTTSAHRHLPSGLALLGLFVLGFEFAVVSALSLASNLVPGRPSTGIGLVFGAGTLGRAAMSVPATVLYERRGIAGPFTLATVAATCCIGLLVVGVPRASSRQFTQRLQKSN